MTDALPDRRPQRVRHELRFRELTVTAVQSLTPHMLRITLTGDALPGFYSPSFDDHVKLFFPDPVTGELVLPTATEEGIRFPEDKPRPAARDYTPRHYDAQANTLAIDFALHDAGPATQWALAAREGDRLGVGGPRGSFLIPTDFDGHVLAGDDTALPAISRRLAELPAGAPALVLVEVDGPEDEITFDTAAAVTLHWLHRRGAAPGSVPLLLDALAGATLPSGDTFAWVACETVTAKALRAALVARGVPASRIKAAGYWRRGTAATHDTHED